MGIPYPYYFPPFVTRPKTLIPYSPPNLYPMSPIPHSPFTISYIPHPLFPIPCSISLLYIFKDFEDCVTRPTYNTCKINNPQHILVTSREGLFFAAGNSWQLAGSRLLPGVCCTCNSTYRAVSLPWWLRLLASRVPLQKGKLHE